MSQAIHISPIDNVVVALHPIAKGQLVETDGLSVTALEDIPQGHKIRHQVRLCHRPRHRGRRPRPLDAHPQRQDQPLGRGGVHL